MGFDLTNERIQDTYQQIVQISGSTLLDGTGSAIIPDVTTISASYAETASFALNVPTIDTSSLTTLATFNAYTSSNDSAVAGKLETTTFTSYSSSVSSEIDVLDAQVGLNITRLNSLTAETSSYLTSADITGKLDTTTFNSYTSSNDSKVDSLIAATSSYLTSLPSGTVSSSAQTIANIAGGTIAPSTINVDTANIQSASIGYLQSITGSAKIIGDAYIILNNDTPTERYAGIVVQDSGSTLTTASFEFDGASNDWFYEYSTDGGATTDHGITLFGPAYNTKGSPTYPTSNTIQKGTGGHHMADSSITDDGSTIDMTGASLLKAPSNMVGGGAPNVGGNRRFVFANGSSTSADDSVILGGESNDISTSYVGMFGTSGTTINSGDLSVVVGGYQHTISGGARNVTIGGQAVTNNQDYAIVLGRQSFTTPNSYTTYVANLDASGSAVISGSITATGQINTPTFAGSVASSTSSIDFDNGNFATLDCSAGSTFLANPSNLKSGTTYTIIITNGANIGNYGTAWKFAGGTQPTLSANTDVLTCVSDGTNLYATALADFS